MKLTLCVAAACLATSQAFISPSVAGVKTQSQLSMKAEGAVDRAAFLKNAAVAAAAFGTALPALAEIDNPVVPLLGGGDKVDVNNANVRAYVKMPGMYPTIAGKIVSNGPYKSAGDVSSISGLTSEEKAIISKYSNRLTATDPQAIYTIDKFNNGLYR